MIAAVLVLVLAGWTNAVVTQWTDRSGALIAVLVSAGVVLLVFDWLLDLIGPPTWRFLRGLVVDIGHAIGTNTGVVALQRRWPRFSGWLKRRFSRHPHGLALTVTVLLAGYFFYGFLAIVFDLLGSAPLVAADPRVSALVEAFRAPELTRFMWMGTVVGGTVSTIFFTAGIALLLWAWSRREAATQLVLTVATGSAAVAVAKLLFHRQRPPAANALIISPSSYSFPSGHSMSGVVMFITLAIVLIPVLHTLRGRFMTGVVCTAIALWIGLSRIYLGVHWATDVYASWCLGLAIVVAFTGGLYIHRSTHPRRARPLKSLSPNRRWIASGAAVAVIACGLMLGAARDPLTRVRVAGSPPPIVHTSLDGNGLPTLSAAEARRLPLVTQKLQGSTQEPVGLIYIGTRQQLTQAFAAAGWNVADKATPSTVFRAAVTALTNQPYATAPVTPAFLGNKTQDIAFEQPDGKATVRRRHHTRFWLVSTDTAGRQIWAATASLDTGLELGSTIPLPTHHIAPDIDTERDYIVQQLTASAATTVTGTVRISQPTSGFNAQGDAFFTAGVATVLAAR